MAGRLRRTDENRKRVHLTPHQWRHTLGTTLINRDVPQQVVQKLELAEQWIRQLRTDNDQLRRELSHALGDQRHTMRRRADRPAGQP
jgi:integrase